MKKLDKSKPFDEIFGFAENGEKYKQDGVYFDLDGNEVGAVAEPEVASLEELAAGKAKKTKAAAPAQASPTEDPSEVTV